MLNIIITSTKSDHITPILVQLHWLPVQHWIDLKTLLLTGIALHNVAPTHLPDLLQEDRPCRSLRHPQLVFTVPILCLSNMGARALRTVGARALSNVGARALSNVGARALRTVGARQARAQIDPKWCSSTSPCALVEKKCPFFLEPNFFFHSSIFLEYKLVSLSSISPNVF